MSSAMLKNLLARAWSCSFISSWTGVIVYIAMRWELCGVRRSEMARWDEGDMGEIFMFRMVTVWWLRDGRGKLKEILKIGLSLYGISRGNGEDIEGVIKKTYGRIYINKCDGIEMEIWWRYNGDIIEEKWRNVGSTMKAISYPHWYDDCQWDWRDSIDSKNICWVIWQKKNFEAVTAVIAVKRIIMCPIFFL